MSKVILRKCEEYDPKTIEEIVADGMRESNFTPKGKTMLKINEVAAYTKQKIFKHATTPPEFVDGALRAIRSDAVDTSEMKKFYLGGKCGITIPTRFSLKAGGQWKVLKKHKVKMKLFDEQKEVTVKLEKGVAHKELRIPKPLYQADTIISLPRFKANPFSVLTASLKMNIGMLDDKERLKHHHYMLDHKIVDILEVANPDFIAVDAIVAGEKNMLEPEPYPMGAIVMGTNPVAVDSILAHAIGIHPMDIPHIRIAHERGYGPVNLDDIVIAGDMSFDEFHERAKGFTTDTDTIDTLESNINFYAGTCGDGNYCFGGCPGSFKEALSIIEGLQPTVHDDVRPMHVVFGNYEGEINAKDGEPIFLLGSNKVFKGSINGKACELNTSMSRRKLKKKSGYKNIRSIDKCPVSVAKNTLLIAHYGKVKNPYLDAGVVVPFGYNWMVSKMKRIFNRYMRP